MTVDEATERLDRLNEEELKRIRAYEREHEDRTALLEEIDCRLNG